MLYDTQALNKIVQEEKDRDHATDRKDYYLVTQSNLIVANSISDSYGVCIVEISKKDHLKTSHAVSPEAVSFAHRATTVREKWKLNFCLAGATSSHFRWNTRAQHLDVS
ncbi:hypothetical protein Ciccas_008424 [Cichlidogyrus casuarinus]|uniref:Uncharacterized protein n=1 Tax=Cichlidogyrus casuarinus TaxID=1844966 RepID=A0ABD2PZZ8_9PLAT